MHKVIKQLNTSAHGKWSKRTYLYSLCKGIPTPPPSPAFGRRWWWWNSENSWQPSISTFILFWPGLYIDVNENQEIFHFLAAYQCNPVLQMAVVDTFFFYFLPERKCSQWAKCRYINFPFKNSILINFDLLVLKKEYVTFTHPFGERWITMANWHRKKNTKTK